MSGYCQVTGKIPGFGKQVSHSHRRTNRQWHPNIQNRKYWVPSLGRHIRITVSTEGIRIIDKRGIESVVADLKQRNEKF